MRKRGEAIYVPQDRRCVFLAIERLRSNVLGKAIVHAYAGK